MGSILWPHTIALLISHNVLYQFDAIVTDPPYGFRERAVAGSPKHGNDTAAAAAGALSVVDPAQPMLRFHESDSFVSVLVTLFRVAALRLKQEGRLVFWYPTKPDTTLEEVEQQLRVIVGQSQQDDRLTLLSCTPEKLKSLCRWLCVVVKN